MDAAELRRLGHALVDRLADDLETVAERPLFPDVAPATLDALCDEPLPESGLDDEALLAELDRKLFPYCTRVDHPGYFGLITPSPTPVGVLGDLVASALNQNLGGWIIGPSATTIERRTVRWLTDLVGWDDGAGGNLTSGGTLANVVGLKLARDRVSGDRAQHEGVRGRWAVYASEDRHVSVDKAADLVGLGREQLRPLPTDDHFRLRLDALEEAIAADAAAGFRPLAIVAMAGATNTGAIDDLAALRAVADRHGAWLHADAAYGGGMLLSRRRPGLLADLRLADSVTLDPHKWFYAPLDAGAVLVRDGGRLTRSFGLQPSYLTDALDTDGERYLYYVHGLEQSRRFRALKVWMSFKRYGAATIASWIDANLAQAERLHARAEAHPRMISAFRPVMSAVLLRWDLGDVDPGAASRLHHEVARRIEASGRFWISTADVKQRTWFRVNPVNLHTRLEDMDALFERLVAECERAEA